MWWVPIVAAVASSLVTSGVNKLTERKPQKPDEPVGGLSSIQNANQALMGNPAADPLQDDILSQVLARMYSQRAP